MKPWLRLGFCLFATAACGAYPEGPADEGEPASTRAELHRRPRLAVATPPLTTARPMPTVASAPLRAVTPPRTPSALCPEGNGSCATADQDRLVCENDSGRYSCVAPPGANACDGGQVCPEGTVCGKTRRCNFETGVCSYMCVAGGPVVVDDLPAGAPCQSTDANGVIHRCSTGLCSGGTSATCLESDTPRPPNTDL